MPKKGKNRLQSFRIRASANFMRLQKKIKLKVFQKVASYGSMQP